MSDHEFCLQVGPPSSFRTTRGYQIVIIGSSNSSRARSAQNIMVESLSSQTGPEVIVTELKNTRPGRKLLHTCLSCGGPNLFTCSRCGRAHYCGKECQRDDWATHNSLECIHDDH
jgi:hypothetical protein